jgi:hypothetical protein
VAQGFGGGGPGLGGGALPQSHSNFELQLFKILNKITMRGEGRLTPWYFIRKKWGLLINAVN